MLTGASRALAREEGDGCQENNVSGVGSHSLTVETSNGPIRTTTSCTSAPTVPEFRR